MERRMLDALDAWISAQPEPRPNRPEAIRRLVAAALGQGAQGGRGQIAPSVARFPTIFENVRVGEGSSEGAQVARAAGVRLRKGAK